MRLDSVWRLLCVVLVTVSVVRAAGEANGGAGPDVRHVKVLAIGNSFTVNATRFLPALVDADPTCTMRLARATRGGSSLQQHAEAAMAHEADPEDKAGLIYRRWQDGGKSAPASLKSFLELDDWDVITIQQVSRLSTKPQTYRPWAAKLVDYIRRYAPDARIVMHQTWAYRIDGDFERVFGDRNYTQADMFRDLDAAYKQVAGELGLDLIPVGRAFQLVRQTPDMHFTGPDPTFDYADPPQGRTPDQEHSLCVGWFWKGGKMRNDSHHANAYGQFVAACVWYEFLFDRDVRKNPFVPGEGVTPQQAVLAKDAAHRAIAGEEPALLR